jgi:hypothetical protein
MMPHAESNTIPAVNDCVAVLSEYAAVLEDALAQTPVHYAGPVYLPTRQTIREAQQAAHLLMASANALSEAPHFAATVSVPGGYTRPVDLLAAALGAIDRAQRAMNAHQQGESTPNANRVGLTVLAEWVGVAADDLRAVLAPTVSLLGRLSP